MGLDLTQGYLLLSAVLFSIGGAGLLLRRSPLVMLMCIEIMLNATNLAFVTFARVWGNMEGHIFTFGIVTVAAAEAAIGLAIIVLLFRRKAEVDIDDAATLRG